MRKLALSALFALGVGLTATAASAAPVSTGATSLNTAGISASLVEQTAVRCRTVRVCRIGPYGRRVCRFERVCRRVW